MGKLIIVEGTDGSGKQTQTELLYKRLKEIKGEGKVKKISFPNYESKASEPVKMYLAGEFGKTAESVNAYAASVLYSVDRFASFKTEWEKFYEDGGIVISDRYTISNMIHQVPKIQDKAEREKYLDWLIDLEWGKIGIPKPDVVFFLDIPFEISQKLMEDRENKITGKKEKDIHEKDKKYLKNAYEVAKELSVRYGWNVISCVNEGKLRGIEDINDEMLEIILKNI